MTAGEESSGAPSPLAVQARVLAYWEATGVPASVLAGRPDGPIFRFTEGPPTANGAPHLGHLVARVLKDVELRYRRMRGMHIVSPMAGWDCHGLPVELDREAPRAQVEEGDRGVRGRAVLRGLPGRDLRGRFGLAGDEPTA